MSFGGKWTRKKLECVKKYVVAYEKVMKKQNFTLLYIDAFAGSGHGAVEQEEQSVKDFQKGSPRVILENTQLFDRYIFVEKDRKKFQKLETLQNDFPNKKMFFENKDANTYLQKICEETNWHSHRAIAFLDPFAIDVKWETIKAIAKTEAIDLWILFPAMAVNRLLCRNKEIPEKLCKKLNETFGSTDWKQDFYQKSQQLNLFGTDTELEKTASFESIKSYYLKKLRLIFSGVADNPLPLKNSRNSTMFYLCFAVSNPKGPAKGIALSIAQYILGQP